MRQFRIVILLFIMVVSGISINGCGSKPNTTTSDWTAPAAANDLKAPLGDTLLMAQKGQELYNIYCWSCHGEQGFGDGAAGHALGQQPANFHSDRVKQQPDGALFWKMTTGRGNMPSFKEVLSEAQRWQLVTYIRKLSERTAPVIPPQALQPGIAITQVMDIAPQAVRILQHPLTNDVYYTTFDGDVYHIKNLESTQPLATKILSVADHGITRLQGAVFYKNWLYLCGNVDTNSKKTTRGRLVRFTINSDQPTPPTVVFNTVNYGANKTIFDHGWNALAVSPDGKNLYVNSGARTDHGEVQDNGGLYPGARDNALTSKIFRFPVEATDLYLQDDEAALKKAGYLYAAGIRNAYDMAFDATGNLFAVVNSSDYDMPEDMFWVREGHHYGFPWIMGGVENPQQYPDWKPDPATDPFINRSAHSWEVKYFHNDPDFPKKPVGVRFTPGVQNMGPDANEYRGHSGAIQDGDTTGVAVSSFTPHASPLALFFDTGKVLTDSMKGDGFVIRYSLGATSSLMKPFTNEGSDLLHLHLTYDATMDNYVMKTKRIVAGFKEPTDAIMIGNKVYVIEYGGKGGHMWKITLPTGTMPLHKSGKAVRK